MATFREQLTFVNGIGLREGKECRIDCPFCGGGKTFTASRSSGKLYWNCYRASCPSRGVTEAEMSAETIRQRLAQKEEQKSKIRSPIPSHLSNIRHHKKAIEYLESVNSMYAVNQNFVTVKFAPAENRVLFFTSDGKGCVGRALDFRKPKWRLYGEVEGILSVGTGRTAVVVEDAASACAISVFPHCSGCAILGTHVTTLARRQLRAFDEVIIALDKDASKKAVKLREKFEGRLPTRVVLLEKDLKYATRDEMERLL